MSRQKMDIVDRLTIALEEVSGERARLHEFTTEPLPALIMEARNEIHRLQGVSYSYPPSHDHHGVTWREEYESLRERFTNMPVDEFLHWKSIMRDE
jgi:hypothetical protein